MMRYDNFSYIWPPRPGNTQAITPSMLASKEAQGCWAQIKKQGTNNTMYVNPDRKVLPMNRHHAEHRQWSPIAQTHMTFANLPGDGWYVFCAELLHSKVADSKLKNINYIHDILVYNGEHLVGTTFAERQDLLTALFPDTVVPMNGIGYRVIDPYAWLATNYRPGLKGGFVGLFHQLTRPEDEGLVMKRPEAKLQYGIRETANDSWQFKCRRPTKNFGH